VNHNSDSLHLYLPSQNQGAGDWLLDWLAGFEVARCLHDKTGHCHPIDTAHGAQLEHLELAHVPAKWIRFADKDMRQHDNRRRFPVILDH
jgi:hypothetical protein